MIAKLPKQTEEEIQRLVETGEYDDGTDVVVHAVHALATLRERAQRERALVLEGLEAAQRGDLIDDTPEFRQALRETAHRLAISGEPLSPDVCG